MRSFVLALLAGAATIAAAGYLARPALVAAVAQPRTVADSLAAVANGDANQSWEWVRNTLIAAAATDAHCEEAASLPVVPLPADRARAKRLALDILQAR
jgi:hypothetical protein